MWNIPKMTDFWSIGSRMEKKLNKLGIYSIRELANCNPDILKKELGVVGVDLFFHANGIDESKALFNFCNLFIILRESRSAFMVY